MPLNIIRAWKDRDYRDNLNEEQLASLPENPAGSIDLTDLTEGELAYMQGGGTDDDKPTTYHDCRSYACTENACPTHDNKGCTEGKVYIENAEDAAGFGAGVVGGAVLWDAVTAGTWTVVTVTV